MSRPPALPPEVLQALERGNLIEAIKLLRQSRGLGLKEAKYVVDTHMGRGAPPHAAKTHAAKTHAAKTHAAAPHAMEPHAGAASASSDRQGVLAALQAGNKIEAIRRMHKSTGMSLMQAKEAVEAMEGHVPRHVQTPGLAPGEVPPSSSRFNWVVLAIAAALIAYFLLRR